MMKNSERYQFDMLLSAIQNAGNILLAFTTYRRTAIPQAVRLRSKCYCSA